MACRAGGRVIAPSDVSAVLVTRGDVDLAPIIESLAGFGEIVIWDNAREPDLSVYGRYAALDRCTRDVVFVQDDDVLLEPVSLHRLCLNYQHGVLVANMPERFRHDFYADHCLVGFGAVFDRLSPARAILDLVEFARTTEPHRAEALADPDGWHSWFNRTCDIVFTGLTPRKLLDLPYTDREFASAPNRMWRQPQHQGERAAMRELVRQAAAA
jgi:hypothetical protein